jgi:hypothetical protein
MKHQYHDDGTPIESRDEAIVEDASREHDGLMLLREFSSTDLPQLAAIPIPGGLRYELTSGPVGNTAQMTWIFGWYSPRFASMYRDEHNQFGEHPTRVFIPTETLMCDLFVHEALSFAMDPRFALHAQIYAGPTYPATGRDRDLVPFAERVVEISARPPAVATTLIPRYPEMVSRVFARMGRSAREFRAFRLVMEYPPMPSVALFRYDLPARD